MKYIWKFINSKIFLVALFLLAGVFAIQANWCRYSEKSKFDEYKRQLNGQLTQKEQELQKAHFELGISNSKLVTQEELTRELEQERNTLDAKFEKFKKEHNLVIKSKDRTIARLEKQISGGNTDVDVNPNTGVAQEVCDDARENCVFAYTWEDDWGRFKLRDPDIFESGNESFSYKQSFRINGEVYEQTDGSLLTRRLTLNEVKLVDGEYVDIPGAEAEIVEADFKYHNPPEADLEDWEWTDLFRLRGVAVASMSVFPDTGRLKLGLGLEFFNFEGLGVNSHTAIDFTDFNRWEQRIGLAYSPRFFGLDLNFALSLSLGTPFVRFGQQWSFNGGIIFYLNN